MDGTGEISCLSFLRNACHHCEISESRRYFACRLCLGTRKGVIILRGRCAFKVQYLMSAHERLDTPYGFPASLFLRKLFIRFLVRCIGFPVRYYFLFLHRMDRRSSVGLLFIIGVRVLLRNSTSS